MSSSVLYMSMSLDGYIADPNDFLGRDDGHRLHDWFAPDGEFVRAVRAGQGAARRGVRVWCCSNGTANGWAHGSLGW